MSERVNKQESNTFQEILNVAVRVPGVRINRNEFLRKSLSKHFQQDVVILLFSSILQKQVFQQKN